MINQQDSIFIETNRLTLGRFIESDSIALANYRSNPEVARYQSWNDYSLADAEKLIHSVMNGEPGPIDQWFQFAIRRKDQGDLIGDVGIKRRINGPSYEADIGYSLAPEHQGQGYMHEAIQALLEWSTKPDIAIRRFVASVDPRNKASIKLLDALSFKKEAHHRQSYWFKGAWVDDAIYAFLR